MQLCLVEAKHGNPSEIKCEYDMVVDCSGIYLDVAFFGHPHADDFLCVILDADHVQN